MRRTVFYLFVFMMGYYNQVFAQGCSDAGFCTTGNMKPLAVDTSAMNKQQLSIYLSNGIGDEGVYVFTPGIQYNLKLSDKWSLQGKFNGNYASGNLGSVFGLGDVILSSTYTKKIKANHELSFLLGAKIPLDFSDIKIENKSLPMQYQSSLGTVDLIAGVTYMANNWILSAAYQQPLTGTNGNNFLPVYWNTSEAAKFAPTNDFNRKGDALLRLGNNFINSKRLIINAGLLGIYHLGEDTYIDGSISNNPIAIKGSDGLTLNGTVAVRYNVNTSIDLILTGGMPFVVRDVRPDGLTRSFVLSPELAIKF